MFGKFLNLSLEYVTGENREIKTNYSIKPNPNRNLGIGFIGLTKFKLICVTFEVVAAFNRGLVWVFCFTDVLCLVFNGLLKGRTFCTRLY